MNTSTSTRTNTVVKNGVKVTTTVVEKTVTYPDGRREVTTTETIDEGGKTTTNVSTTTEQGAPSQVRESCLAT